MSLDFDTTNIDPDDRAYHFPADPGGSMHHDLHVLIWMTIPVGINKVTEANVEEFWTRVDIWQRVIGSGFNRSTDDGLVPYVVSKEAVFAAVGLSTNASHKSKTTFLKDLYTAHGRV